MIPIKLYAIFSSAACSVFMIAALTVVAPTSTFADDPVIHFDLPPIVAAQPVDSDAHHNRIHCDLRLSSLIASPSVPRIDQWIVRCQPREPQVSIADYSPRSEVGSDVDGPIQIKITDEQTSVMGFSLNGDYAKVAKGGVVADQTAKKSQLHQYNQIAAVHSVVASGSINRGRGVYFKLRWTAQQVLEGEKSFQLTLEVPDDWRGSLIDISVIAQSQHRSFTGSQVKTLGAADFVVAAYRDGDADARQLARRIAAAEQSLHRMSRTTATQASPQSLPEMLRHFAAKLDLDTPCPNTTWITRLLKGQADPYLDKEINRLPMDSRIAAIEYCDARDDFEKLTQPRL